MITVYVCDPEDKDRSIGDVVGGGGLWSATTSRQAINVRGMQLQG